MSTDKNLDEVTHPAIAELNRLVKDNQITPEMAKILNFKFDKLQAAFTQSCNTEQILMRRTRTLNKELKAQKMTIENSAQQQQGHRAQLSSLRQFVTSIQVDLESIIEQINATQVNTKMKEKEKEKLDEKVSKAQENQRVKLDPQKQQIQEENANLEEMISKRKEKIQLLIRDGQELQAKIQKCDKQIQEIESKKKELNKKMLEISSLPLKIHQKAVAAENALGVLLKEEDDTLLQIDRINENINRQYSQRQDLENEIQHVIIDTNGIFEATNKLRKQYDTTTANITSQKESQTQKEYEFRLMTKSIKEREYQIGIIDQQQASLLKEIEKKESETLKTEEAIARYMLERETMLSQLKTCQQDAEEEKQRNVNLQKELDQTSESRENALKAFLAMESINEKLLQEIKNVLIEKDKKQAILGKIVLKEKDLIQTLKESAMIRTRKARELTVVKRKVLDVKSKAMEKNLNFLDLSRKLDSYGQKIIDTSQLYEKAKLERNRYVNTIQTTKQQTIEFKEKIKILDNEVDVLRNELTQVDAAVNAQKHQLSDAFKRREATKCQLKEEEDKYKVLQRQIDYQVTETARLNAVLQNIEDIINRQQGRYTIQADDCANIQRMLIDKQDELCIIYEQYNRHEETMKRGEQILKEKEEELKALNLQLNDFARRIDVYQRKIPLLKKYQEDIEELQKQIDFEQKDVDNLTKKLEVPDENERKRQYCGKDFSNKELDNKILIYEQRVNDKKRQLVEKQIILRDLNEKITDIKTKLSDHSFSKSAKALEKGGNVRADTMKMRRKKMAALSEMAIYQAQQGELQEQKKIIESEIQEAGSRTARGESFDDYADKMVKMIERDIKTAHSPKRKSLFDSDDEDEERPPGRQKFDAYPTADGLSRPYGAFPVFQPAEPSPNLRYYKKEEERPIVV